MNCISVIGRLVADPELKHLQSGTAVCSARIAVDRAGSGKDENDNYVTGFFDVTFWGRTAEIVAEHLVKGRQLGVTGELRHETWKDKDTGDNRSKVTINARSMTFVGNRGDGEGGVGDGGGRREADEDIPF